ncbi:hypothetical protein IAD21_01740 [Abditibacteriota bacterium]|nr:hypothetical protein IAD21_01740 [Abditibacteriota bacterium]
MKNTIIYLIGFPGTGKYTIAKEIAASSRARLIDNHLINNPIFSVLRTDGKTKLPKEVWDYTRRLGDIVREAVVELGAPEENFIFTNSITQENASDNIVYDKISQVAEQRASVFVPVRLLCSLPTLQSRIVGRDRTERMKMTDAAAIADFYNKFTVFDPQHPHQITLDVTEIQPHQAASQILAHSQTLPLIKD